MNHGTLALQILNVQGPMTVPELVVAINNEMVGKPEKLGTILYSVKQLIEQKIIPSHFIKPTELPTRCTFDEMASLRRICRESKRNNQVHSLRELAQLVITDSKSTRSVEQMELKIRLMLIPLVGDHDDCYQEE